MDKITPQSVSPMLWLQVKKKTKYPVIIMEISYGES
jgi:hypothetical protein